MSVTLVLIGQSFHGYVCYAEGNGSWLLSEKWPIFNNAVVVIVCDGTPKIPEHYTTLKMSEFLGIMMDTTGIYAHTLTSSSRDYTHRALASNMALINRYRLTGMYEESFELAVTLDMIDDINVLTDAYTCVETVLKSDSDKFNDMLTLMPDYVIDIYKISSYTRNLQDFIRIAERVHERKVVHSRYVLPKFTASDADPDISDVGLVLQNLRDCVHRSTLIKLVGSSDKLNSVFRAIDI
jgi:hypothetical protein